MAEKRSFDFVDSLCGPGPIKGQGGPPTSVCTLVLDPVQLKQ